VFGGVEEEDVPLDQGLEEPARDVLAEVVRMISE
jgi:hypothetical protein